MKKLNRLTGGVIATAAASAAIVSMTTTAAHAATTFTPTVSGGGTSVTFTGSSVSFTDIAVAQTLTCTQFDLSGSVVSNGVSRAYGANAGNLSTLTSSGCSNGLAGPTTVSAIGTWGVTVTGDATGTSWPARLTNVRARVTATSGCDFTVSGVVNGKFNDAVAPATGAQRFTPNSGASGLVIDDGLPAGSGEIAPTGPMCVTLDLQPGDDIAVGGYWTASPNLDISNP